MCHEVVPSAGFRIAVCSGFGCWRSLCYPAFPPPSRLTNTIGPNRFFRHRDATLAYTGPESDFTNLTEMRIGWFGPHDATNHLGADAWWAANLAVQEANEQGGYTPHAQSSKAGHAQAERGVYTTSPPARKGGAGRDPSSSDNSDLKRLEDCAPSTSAGANGMQFRLVPRWAVDPWGTGISQLTRMIYDEQPLAVIGSVDSASTHLAEQIVAKAQLPLVSPVATDKSVTLAGVSWMFACAPSDDAIARVLVDDLLARLKTNRNRFALLAGTDHESRMAAQEVLRECSRRGRLPDFRFELPPGAPVVAEQLASLKQMQPTVVLIVANAEDSARLVSLLRKHLPNSQLFGSPSFGRSRFLQVAGAAAEGVRFPVLFTPDSKDPATVHFLERFRAEHDHEPDYTAALAYDATRLLLEAIRRAGPNRARIREALTQLSPWPSIAGPICFDGTGQNIWRAVRMGTITNGRILPETPRSERKAQD